MKCTVENTSNQRFIQDHPYLVWVWGERRNWRDIQNLQLVYAPVQNDGGSVNVPGSSRSVNLGEIIVYKLTDYRSFPDTGSTDNCDTKGLHHSWRISTMDSDLKPTKIKAVWRACTCSWSSAKTFSSLFVIFEIVDCCNISIIQNGLYS